MGIFVRLCGAAAGSIGLHNVADLQIGSWPPGDARRWQFGRSCIISVAVCKGYTQAEKQEESSTAATTPAAYAAAAVPAVQPNRLALADDALALRARLYAKSSHRLPCKVGDFATISGVFWDESWRSMDEAMTLCRGHVLPDAVIPCPMEPSIERVCLQVKFLQLSVSYQSFLISSNVSFLSILLTIRTNNAANFREILPDTQLVLYVRTRQS